MSYKNRKIFYLNKEQINFWDILKIKLYIVLHKDLTLAVDMQFVKNVGENFLEFIKKQAEKQKLALLNLNSELISVLGLRNYDKYVTIYADENSFYENKRNLVNRRFTIY